MFAFGHGSTTAELVLPRLLDRWLMIWFGLVLTLSVLPGLAAGAVLIA